MTLEEFFDHTGIKTYYQVLDWLAALDRGYEYTFMPMAKFERLVEIRERMRVYWFEICERAHCGAICALLRLKRWIDSMALAARGDNFPAFGASFRGLLESAADTRYALGEVPEELAATFQYAYMAVRRQAAIIVLCPDLEDKLIHFSHGRRLKSKGDAPKSHMTKKMSDYMKALEGAGSGPLHNCYAELCEITHPAAQSVLYLLEKQTGGAISYRNQADEAAILDLCKRGGTVATYSASETILYPLIILRILNRLGLEELQTPAADEISLEEASLWKEIAPRLGKPHGWEQ